MRTIARVLLLVLLVTASATAADPPRSVVLNFDNADVEVVVQAVAEIVGFNYVFGPNVRGRKVTVQTVGKISREDLLPFLLTILDANGLAAVQTDGVYRIITREGASQTPVRTVVGREAAPGPAGGEIITQVVPLAFLSAADAVTMLRPYVAAEGSLSAHRETNLLIVTDTASNIRRLLDIIKVMDVPVALEEPQIIPLQYADAQEIAQLLNQMFVTGRARGGGGAIVSPGVPAAPPAQGRRSSGVKRAARPSARPSSSPSAARTRSSSTRAGRISRRFAGWWSASTSTCAGASRCSCISRRTPKRAIWRPHWTPSTAAGIAGPRSPAPRSRAAGVASRATFRERPFRPSRHHRPLRCRRPARCR
jgi:type II secretory pathway component GspD/PulD (secretin)